MYNSDFGKIKCSNLQDKSDNLQITLSITILSIKTNGVTSNIKMMSVNQIL